MKHFAPLGMLLLLAACISGPCSDQHLLQPMAIASGGFSVSIDAENDNLFLESQNVALWLKPCIANYSGPLPAGRLLPGTLCGTVIVSPGTSFRFVDATASVSGRPSIQIQAVNFKLGIPELGSSARGASGWLVNRPYKLPGSRLDFVILQQPYDDAPIQLRLPQIEVNSVQMTLPPISITPTVGRRCYHGPW